MAATKVTMTLTGLDSLKRAVTEAPKALRAGSADNVRQSAWVIADRMRVFASAHADSGTLLRNIEAVVPVKTGLTAYVRIGREAFYWRFLEYGTVKMAARPFVRPATEREAQPFIGRFRALAQRLEAGWGR